MIVAVGKGIDRAYGMTPKKTTFRLPSTCSVTRYVAREANSDNHGRRARYLGVGSRPVVYVVAQNVRTVGIRGRKSPPRGLLETELPYLPPGRSESRLRSELAQTQCKSVYGRPKATRSERGGWWMGPGVQEARRVLSKHCWNSSTCTLSCQGRPPSPPSSRRPSGKCSHRRKR